MYFPGIWNVVKLLFLAEVKDYRNEDESACHAYNKDADYPIYVYVIRSGSITTSDVSLRKSSDILKIADELYLFLKTNSLSVKYKRMIYSSIATIAGVYYSVFYAKLNVHEQIEVLSMFFNRAYWIKSFILSGKIYYFIRWLKMYYLNVKYEYFFSKKSSKYNFED